MRDGRDIGKDFIEALKTGDDASQKRLLMDVLLDIRGLLQEQTDLIRDSDDDDFRD